MPQDYVTITLTQLDATLYAQFQKYYDNINFLTQQGVFDIKSGSATLNFDATGTILSIEKRNVISRKKPLS